MATLHQSIRNKLSDFYIHQRIPNLLFHGSSGSGKRTLVYNYIHQIYEGSKEKLKTNVMFVNCAHGKGIKFIREDLKFFAKSNLKGTQGVQFKTIVLFNADNLTIDAQSALRRCIELFSFNTRFFIIIENKEKLLNPILSRFCEIYVPEIMDAEGNVHNLHQYHLDKTYGPRPIYFEWFKTHIEPLDKTPLDFTNIVSDAYEEGFSCMDLMKWIEMTDTLDEHIKTNLKMDFHKIRCEFKCEKLLMFTMCMKLPIRFID
jgi:hypothetical protein